MEQYAKCGGLLFGFNTGVPLHRVTQSYTLKWIAANIKIGIAALEEGKEISQRKIIATQLKRREESASKCEKKQRER